MNKVESLNAKELIQQAEEIGLLNSNSTVRCHNCNVVFPTEYNQCPKCEIDALWKDVRIQFKNNFGV
ncbi:MAG: hypothetical protein OES14_04175 [Nitrosopumilus sp.]|nr:hypothetical protein [Nitrosopumilus sp.]MDH3824969.1 hypothetical protein [Nitrosopumilus sp.]